MPWFYFLANWLKKRGRWRMIYRTREGTHVRACGTQYRGCAPECTYHNDPVAEDYLERFYILSTKCLGVYLHRFWASDSDGLHDHPWHSISILLSGAYFEEEPERQSVPTGPTVKHRRSPLRPVCKIRTKYYCHRLTVPEGTEGQCWSLFIRFGLKRRKWGFYEKSTWQKAKVQSRRDKDPGTA